MVDLAFTVLAAHRVCGRHRRPQRRLGPPPRRASACADEAHLVQNEWVKGEWADEVVFGVLAEEWSARRP